MTIQEAFLYSEKNQAPIRHRLFLPEEYIIVTEQNVIMEDEDFMLSKKDFLKFRASSNIWNKDWEKHNS